MPAEPLRILVSFAYMNEGLRTALEAAAGDVEWILDSGAFTAWKLGKPIDPDAYAEFVESLTHPPLFYLTLDVIGDPAATRLSHARLRSRGLSPVPIFTRGEQLDRFYEESEIAAIGSLVGTERNEGFLRAVMEHVGGRAVHWLGFGRGSFLSYYRPFSCDSTSWMAGLRFGALKLYAGRGRFLALRHAHFASRPAPAIMAACEAIGVDPRRLARRAEWTNPNGSDIERATELQQACYRSWVRYQRDVWRTLGVRHYLVVGNEQQLTKMLTARRALPEEVQ